MTDLPMDPMEPEQQSVPGPPPFVDPEAGNTAADDTLEVEARDELGLKLILAAESAADASRLCRGANDADGCEKYAQSAHKLVQAIVLLIPVTAADDIVAGSQGTGMTTNRGSRTDQ